MPASIPNGPEGGAGAEDAASSSDAGIDVSLIRAELVRSLRHDLRTHVSHVVGFSEILQHKATEAGHTALLVDLRKIETAGWGLLGFLTETLDLAKIEAGKLQPELITSQLRALLHSILGQTDQLGSAAASLGWQEALDDLHKIADAAQHLIGFIDDVVDLSQFGLGDEAEPEVRAEDAAARAGSSQQGAGSGSVLVVDDSALDREMLAWRLGRLGYAVTLAEDGFSALELLARQDYDLVLLDVVMPEMNGFDVLEELKADDRLRHVPVIVVSALDGIDWVARCIANGAEDYLPKPFDPIILKARIEASLEKKRLRDREVMYLAEIEVQKKRSDELLHVILPSEVVDELKMTNQVQPRRHDHVAVLFVDVVSFTPYCDGKQPQEIVGDLQYLIRACEVLALKHDLQKIKTMGDAFMAAAGLLKPVGNPVLNCVACGLGMIQAAQTSPANWNVRVGIHVGPVVSGVIGDRQYLFDLWGDTVNVAARMESHGLPGYVTLSRPAWEEVSAVCEGESLGMVPIKGKAEQEMFRIAGLKPNWESALIAR